MNTLSGLKVLVVLSRSGFRDDELASVRAALAPEGVVALLASPDGGEAVGSTGTKVQTVIVSDPRSAELIGAVVLSETGAPHMWGNGLVHKTLRMIAREGKPVAAIGGSAVVLARGGMLQGRKATVFVTTEALHELKEGGAHYEKRQIVIDSGILTAESPAAAGRIVTMMLEMVRMRLAPPASGGHARPSGGHARPSGGHAKP